ncbi:MAG TPA: cupredoxin domain-containing protein [Nitrosopumilaceae archaeon]|nr:cupredoxin domain-containing protein [Nitrosopumilaceae archaeon]
MEDKKLIIAGIVGGLVLLASLSAFVGFGNVRHTPIFWQETIKSTVAFEKIDGQTRLVGVEGNSEINPTLVMRADGTLYILTIINRDDIPHMFYVEGLDATSKVLRAGENDTITLVTKNEGTFSYYDRFDQKPLGVIKAVKISTFD